MSKQIVVLMGGWSSERKVSLLSGAACTNALQKAGFIVTPLDVKRDIGAMLTHLYPPPYAVFNALHGRWGEDGCIQGLLDILKIPYTHSGLVASAAAMDKPLAKCVFKNAGIPIARHVIATREQVLAGGVMDVPYVIKPLNEGSSVDVHIVHDEKDGLPFEEDEWPYGEKVMIEKFIAGRELTVAVMGGKAMAVTEIDTEHGFYDFDAKYVVGESAHTLPADLPEKVYNETMRLAERAHTALGCRGISRSDFRYDGETVYILETNTQPGMTKTSLVPEQAAHVGINFEALVKWMIDHAECDE
ncbi:MAG: D-alanine--D-alanine ligase [Rhodospirillaceae bacterium]|nr:MAG: D-alanine--D-alanine ligase [Rhodospirillaceae bacterium]